MATLTTAEKARERTVLAKFKNNLLSHIADKIEKEISLGKYWCYIPVGEIRLSSSQHKELIQKGYEVQLCDSDRPEYVSYHIGWETINPKKK